MLTPKQTKGTYSTFSCFSNSSLNRFAPIPVTATFTFPLLKGRVMSHFLLIISVTALQPECRGVWNI